MGQGATVSPVWASLRSHALDDLCALAVAASTADAAVMTLLRDGRHEVIGRHGTRADGFPSRIDSAIDWEGIVALERTDAGVDLVPALVGGALDRVEALLVLPLRQAGVAVGVVLMAAREARFTQADRAVIYRVRQLAEAQMEAEATLMQMARRAFHRIEAARD
jgi:GAF domain-containing protein